MKKNNIDFKLFTSNNYLISNQIINSFEIGFANINNEVTIENCIIDCLEIHSTWFTRGLNLKGNIIKNSIDYQMGGHNSCPIRIEENIFEGFFNFFDCHFEDIVFITNNVFKKGTNILGNINEGYKNTFENGFEIRNNIGNIYMNQID
jgi:hypothetical protein